MDREDSMPTLGSVKALDRASHLRTNTEWQVARREDSGSQFLLLIDLKPAILANEVKTETRLRWFSHDELAAFGLAEQPVNFLGIDGTGRAHFAMPITEHRARLVPGGPFILKPYVDLRSLAIQGALVPDELSLAGLARGLAEWHINCRCCGHCGSATDIKDGGWRRRCWSCGRDHFPRTDPVVIMLVTHGDTCLISHEPRFKDIQDRMFSALAGFLEPGEDIEHAVRREVKEEVGLDVGKVSYLESQPWPFPHSLMIGCFAEATDKGLTLDPNEIAEARWITRDDALAMLERRHPEGLTVPGPHAIANKLIRHFIAQGHA